MLRAADPSTAIVPVAAQRRGTRARADLSPRRVGAAVSFEERTARIPLMQRRVAEPAFSQWMI